MFTNLKFYIRNSFNIAYKTKGKICKTHPFINNITGLSLILKAGVQDIAHLIKWRHADGMWSLLKTRGFPNPELTAPRNCLKTDWNRHSAYFDFSTISYIIW